MAVYLRGSFLFIFLAFLPVVATAQSFTSENFEVFTPVIAPSSYSTSTNFSLFSILSPEAIASSTASLYNLFSGFLYFPYISTPVVSATPGNTEVALSWTAADGVLGWSVGSYAVGQGTTSGGPYTYTNVGNTLSSTRTGLSNGTTYYFILRVLDSVGNVVATSTQVSGTPVAPSGGTGGGGGGGGGGGSPPSLGSGVVNFSGRAYPRSTVTVLKDAQVVATTIADALANFQVSVSGLGGGNYLFSVYGEDNKGVRSSLITFPVSVTSGATTNIGGIFITPTIGVDKSEVRKGDNIAIFGQTVAQSDVTIQVNSEETLFAQTKADSSGIYLYNFDTTPLEYGEHSTKSKSSIAGEISQFSAVAEFRVGTQNILATPPLVVAKKGDVNGDKRVNLVDFSIAAYWFRRPSPPTNVDLNKDSKVDLVDFSILAFNWTG